MIARQADVRSNMKKYLDIAYNGEPVIIPRKQGHNVVIISEEEYRRLSDGVRMAAYAEGIRTIRRKRDDTDDNGIGELLSHNMKKLSAIREFQTGWNGNGAPAFSTALLDRVEELLRSLVIQPEIFPTALGSIQLEYDNSRRDHLEIDIPEEGPAEVYLVRFNGEEELHQLPATPDEINRRVRLFYE